MISAELFYNKYWDSLPVARTDKFSISIMTTMNSDFLFYVNFFGRYHAYIFNMVKPEVIAINKWFEPKYISLTKDDIELIMDGLINKGFWDGCIDMFNNFIDSIDNCKKEDGTKLYTCEMLKSIPDTPPDYRLIWENGYTGKEDDDFVSYDYG